MKNEKYISRCIELAQRGQYWVAPNPMVGAVLTDEAGNIIGEGWHEQFGGPHAEVNCIRHAEENGYTDFSRSTLYVSLEPCSHYGKTPPCAKLIIEKGIRHVVVGAMDPNPQVAGRGVNMLREAGIRVETGVMEDECRKQNKRFICLHEKHRPYVILKWAQTEDGFLDRKRQIGCGKPLVISSPETKEIVHQMRAENMAIMVGTNTVLLDNPRLQTTRHEGRNPIRITMDRHGKIPADSRIYLADERPNTPEYPGDKVIVYRDNTDWEYMLSDMGQRGIHSVLVEGGKQLFDHIFATGIWDEIHVEIGNIRIGDGVPAPIDAETIRWIREENLPLQSTAERLMRNEPIQYIVGHMPWMGLELNVTRDTLIPRPETADLIGIIGESAIAKSGQSVSVLDIGTGSGCIAIALKKRHPLWNVTGLDISAEALATAQTNAAQNDTEIHWMQSDILSDEINGKWDIVVSNPPYVCESEKADMEKNVLDWEPATALFVPDNNPLLFYRRIAELRLGKELYFEINERMGDAVCAMLQELGYSHVSLRKDIYGKDRFVAGRLAE